MNIHSKKSNVSSKSNTNNNSFVKKNDSETDDSKSKDPSNISKENLKLKHDNDHLRKKLKSYKKEHDLIKKVQIQ